MNFIILNYRDPLFSVLVLVFLVITVAVANKIIEKIKANKQKRKITSFIKSFEIGKKTAAYKDFLLDKEQKTSSLALLASLKSRQGEYEEAIRIYLDLLEILIDKQSKIEIMVMLGQTYFKVGFLQRSKTILLEAIKLIPRNKKALYLLLVIYENLKDYKKANEVIDVLAEIGENMQKQKSAAKILEIINNPKLSNDKKTLGVVECLKQDKNIERLAFEYLSSFATEDFWKNIKEEQVLDLIDILWNFEKSSIDFSMVENSMLLQEIYSAKGYINTADKSEIFELDLILNLKDKQKAELKFEYLCTECNNNFPLAFYRCPMCQAIFSSSINLSLIKPQNKEQNGSSAGFY